MYGFLIEAYVLNSPGKNKVFNFALKKLCVEDFFLQLAQFLVILLSIHCSASFSNRTAPCLAPFHNVKNKNLNFLFVKSTGSFVMLYSCQLILKILGSHFQSLLTHKTQPKNFVSNFLCQVWRKNVHSFKHTNDLAYEHFGPEDTGRTAKKMAKLWI